MLLEFVFTSRTVYYFIANTSDSQRKPRESSPSSPSPEIAVAWDIIKLLVLGFISIFQNICNCVEHETIALEDPAQFLNLLSVVQSSTPEKNKKKIKISPTFAETGFYKSTLYSRLTMFWKIFEKTSYPTWKP